MTSTGTFWIIFLWSFWSMHFVLVLIAAFVGVWFYSQSMKNRVRTLSYLVSSKSLKLLHAIVQPLYNFFLIVNFCGELYCSTIFIVCSVLIDHKFSSFVHDSPWMWGGLNLIPIVFYSCFYFWFYRTYVSKVSLTFKYVNKDISFLTNCRFVDQKRYNFMLHWIVNRSIQKRLLNRFVSFKTSILCDNVNFSTV